jgi:outer membrane lipoprotein-sorting protein
VGVFTVAPLFTEGTDPIQAALDHYQQVTGYEATLSSHSGRGREIIRYAYRKPGLVRIEFVTPHRGAVLIYDPDSGAAKLWPFGYRRLPALSLSPSNPLIQSPTGQRVDRSDVGVLYRNVQALQARGATEVVGVEDMGPREAVHVEVRGNDGCAVGAVAGYRLWLDRDSGFPLKVVSIDGTGRVIETVEMTELRIAPDFPEDFFRQ